MVRRVLALAVLLSAAPARADEVADLVARGEELAKQSEYTQAIATFKQADALRPRAAHACMIGLAYMRREAWPQAELWLALCEKRAVPGDQPPAWIDAAHQQLAAKLSAAQVPAITIEVAPATAGAKLTISSFAPDERFDPQTIHLAPGTHVIEVTAPHYHPVSREVTIRAGEPQTLRIALSWDPSQDAPRTRSGGREAAERSKLPWVVIGAGTALAGFGLAYDLWKLQPARDRLRDSETGAIYDANVSDFTRDRRVTVALLAGGAISIAVGVALRLTVFADAPKVTATVDAHGAGIAIGWSR